MKKNKGLPPIENRNYPRVRKCICCGEIINAIDSPSNVEKRKPEQNMWNGGMVKGIEAGYGSSHDGDKFYISICDKCIRKKVQEGVLEFIGNYFCASEKYTNDKELYANYKSQLKLFYDNKED